MTTAHVPTVPASAPAWTTDPQRLTWLRASWGPVMMGALTAIATQFVFTMLGLAIGITAADPGSTADPGTLSVAAGAWWLITGTISLFLGGMVYGRVSALARNTQLYLGALAMWSAVALFGFLVVWSGAGIASNAASPIALVAGRTGISEAGITAGADRADNAALNVGSQAGLGAGDVNNRPTTEQSVRAARTASWWAVVGLLAGVVASVAGAGCGVARGYTAQRPV